LKHHAHLPAQGHDVDAVLIDVFPVDKYRTVHSRFVYYVVHPIERAKKGRFSAPRRADKGRDATGIHVHGYGEEGLALAVIKIEAFDLYFCFFLSIDTFHGLLALFWKFDFMGGPVFCQRHRDCFEGSQAQVKYRTAHSYFSTRGKTI
jgi:hypothetical protein